MSLSSSDRMYSTIPPDAYMVIIGAGKSGTTTLFRMLSDHPGICPARRKEPNFFLGRGARAAATSRYEDLYDFDPDRHVRALEASVRYTTFPWEIDVPKRMKDYGINPLFVYCVRDPFQRLESDYNFSRLSLSRSTSQILDLGAVHRSMYYMQLREFLHWYPDPDRYLIVDFDDIASRPAELTARIFSWAGLQEHMLSQPARENTTPSFSRLEHRLKTASVPWRKYFPQSVRQGAAQLLRRYDTSAKQSMSPAEREQLREWLQPDMERFRNTFGFAVEKWGFTPSSSEPETTGMAPGDEARAAG